jgi:hypothetical protein
MDAPVPQSVRSALTKLRKDLQHELSALVVRRSGLEMELQVLTIKVESKQRALELVEASERQLAGQGSGKDDSGASVRVRASATMLEDLSESG